MDDVLRDSCTNRKTVILPTEFRFDAKNPITQTWRDLSTIRLMFNAGKLNNGPVLHCYIAGSFEKAITNLSNPFIFIVFGYAVNEFV